MIGNRKIQFFGSKENSCIAIRERNMAAIELLLEYECNLHRTSKESFKKFYDIEGYKNYLDGQVKKFFKAIEDSIESSDVKYFKLLVTHIHPDILNHPIERKTSFCNSHGNLGITIDSYLERKYTIFSPEKGTCISPLLQNNHIERENACTLLDYVYTRCHSFICGVCQNTDRAKLNWSLINFLRKYGALTYEELMASTPQTNMYEFKLPHYY